MGKEKGPGEFRNVDRMCSKWSFPATTACSGGQSDRGRQRRDVRRGLLLLLLLLLQRLDGGGGGGGGLASSIINHA